MHAFIITTYFYKSISCQCMLGTFFFLKPLYIFDIAITASEMTTAIAITNRHVTPRLSGRRVGGWRVRSSGAEETAFGRRRAFVCRADAVQLFTGRNTTWCHPWRAVHGCLIRFGKRLSTFFLKTGFRSGKDRASSTTLQGRKANTLHCVATID